MFFYKFRKVPEDKLTQRFNKEENIDESLLKSRTMLPSFSYRHCCTIFGLWPKKAASRAQPRAAWAWRFQTVSTQVRGIGAFARACVAETSGPRLGVDRSWASRRCGRLMPFFSWARKLPAKVREALSAPHSAIGHWRIGFLAQAEWFAT